MDKLVLWISLAGLTVEIHHMYGELTHLCKDYTTKIHWNPEIQIDIEPEDIRRAEKDSCAINLNVMGNGQSIYPNSHLEVISVYQKIVTAMTHFNIFLMHGAVVAYNGEGYMFSAPSGTGKTTRVVKWMELFSESFVVNGDKPLLHIKENSVVAYGTPWCGKEQMNTNTSVPLRAIFFLERTEDGEENIIRELTFSEAFTFLLRQTYRPEDQGAMRKTLQLLKAMNGKVKFYRLRSDRSEEAIRLAYETARPK